MENMSSVLSAHEKSKDHDHTWSTLISINDLLATVELLITAESVSMLAPEYLCM